MDSMKKLVQELNDACAEYYNRGGELMSNFEYDRKLEELRAMEKEMGVVLPDSPTQRVGYQVVGELNKVTHEYPALSLSKTKDVNVFESVFDVCDKKAVVMWKEDGSTVVATYDGGKLVQLATRGNGEVGQDITHNAGAIKGIPATIPYDGKLIVRGEAVMSYAEFDRINAALPYGAELYKNPRNLANSTISLLDSRIAASREICFKAFTLVAKADGMPFLFEDRLQMLDLYGFSVVEYQVAEISQLVEVINDWGEKVKDYPFPVDGLVVAANDAEYAELQPGTGSNPNKLVGFALKWEDETVQTTLRNIEWSASRTGLLNPVAVFDSVELEGTTVTRASLHNVSYVLDKNLKTGDRILVYKANKIIPQVAENLDKERHGLILPGYIENADVCPVCGYSTEVVRSRVNNSVTLTLWCKNPECSAKHIGKFVHFCERDCMNIEGLSEATIDKFVERGWLKEWADMYSLVYDYGKEIEQMEGFGKKSVENIDKAIEKSRNTSFVPFIHALAIPNIGKGQAKLFNKIYKGDVMRFFEDIYNRKGFQHIEGIGEVLETNLWNWGNKYLKWIPWDKDDNEKKFPTCNLEVWNLLQNVILAMPEEKPAASEMSLDGKIFVITGDVHIFKNRAELQEKIEELGGKATGSVTGKTSYLINNDVNSTSGKNKKAKELGVPIISEEEFMKLI